ncbi:hypothetical protein T310_8979, partial [Rasamsonia emersonii CBS 393.64]
PGNFVRTDLILGIKGHAVDCTWTMSDERWLLSLSNIIHKLPQKTPRCHGRPEMKVKKPTVIKTRVSKSKRSRNRCAAPFPALGTWQGRKGGQGRRCAREWKKNICQQISGQPVSPQKNTRNKVQCLYINVLMLAPANKAKPVARRNRCARGGPSKTLILTWVFLTVEEK